VVGSVFEDAAKTCFDVFVGEKDNATYSPETGDPVPCRFLVTGLNVARDNYPEHWTASLTGQVLALEVGSSIRMGERIEYNGKTYVIAEDPYSMDEIVWELVLNEQ
jgi:hypothetical protein